MHSTHEGQVYASYWIKHWEYNMSKTDVSWGSLMAYLVGICSVCPEPPSSTPLLVVLHWNLLLLFWGP